MEQPKLYNVELMKLGLNSKSKVSPDFRGY